MNILVAVLAALMSAVCFGVASVVQQYAASRAPRDQSLHLRLLLNLARQPLWLAGMALTVFSYVMQGLALAFGPLVLVQPVAATDLAFALPLLAWRRSERLTRPEQLGIACTAGGVAAFVTVLPPASAGTAVASLRDWLPVLFGVACTVTLLVAVGLRSRGRLRTGLYAAAAASMFALLDSLTKGTSGRLRTDGLGALTHWEPYALLGVGITGLVLSQSSFQAGSLAISLPLIDTIEPIGGVLIGIVVFDERLASSAGALLIQVLGALVAVVGIVLLARSPLARPLESPPEEPPRTGRT
ncbi:DMT family transporter [Kitasatospora sp. NPDC093679]|uniref:DMT family transporter n=1 Tax=Kitasatospora sp. NPDC093679 TaxID=3154983 RepID=UPI003429E8C7